MADDKDLEYFAKRAIVEREMSDTASEPGIALIHAQLADRYEELARGNVVMRSGLTVVDDDPGTLED